MKRVGVVVFPGSNCEYDAARGDEVALGVTAEFVWHSRTDLSGFDAIILPGGFAHGDYLRPGALARFSPVMERGRAIRPRGRAGARHLQRLSGAHRGRDCLPGALQKNVGLTFLCQPTTLVVTSTSSVLTAGASSAKSWSFPSTTSPAPTPATTRRSAHSARAARSCCATSDNPNGSRGDIAGVANERGNVVGLMPHPERAMSTLLGQRRWTRALRELRRGSVRRGARREDHVLDQ